MAPATLVAQVMTAMAGGARCPMIFFLAALLPAAFTPSPLRAVDPGPNVPSHVVLPPGPGGPTGLDCCGLITICDQMTMAEEGTYDAGNGNAIAGQEPFDEIFDLQTADDCVVPAEGCWVYEVCQASVTYQGATPATAVWVQVYADAGGAPAATASFTEVAPPGTYTVTPFEDTVFGLEGVAICATFLSIKLPPGTWWFDIQPVDTTAGGDWYYIVRDTGGVSGGDTHGKDGGAEHGSAFGGPYPGGYETSTWTPMGALGRGAGDSAMSVSCLIPVELQTFDVE